MTLSLVINLVLATVIVATIVGLLGWAIATQSRDDLSTFADRRPVADLHRRGPAVAFASAERRRIERRYTRPTATT